MHSKASLMPIVAIVPALINYMLFVVIKKFVIGHFLVKIMRTIHLIELHISFLIILLEVNLTLKSS